MGFAGVFGVVCGLRVCLSSLMFVVCVRVRVGMDWGGCIDSHTHNHIHP